MNNQGKPDNSSKHIVIKDVMKEAWELVSGLKWPIFMLLVLVPILYFSFLALVMLALVPRHLFLTLPFFIISGCMTFLVMWCIFSMAVMLGVRQAIGLTSDFDVVYAQCMQVKEKLFYLFLVWLLISGGYIVAKYIFIPGGLIGMAVEFIFYLVLLYLTLPIFIFAIPQLVTQNCDITSALEDSYATMKEHWFKVMVCYLLMGIILTISAIPFGIGLIWTVPMHYCMTGILFRNAYGLKRKLNPASLNAGSSVTKV